MGDHFRYLRGPSVRYISEGMGVLGGSQSQGNRGIMSNIHNHTQTHSRPDQKMGRKKIQRARRLPADIRIVLKWTTVQRQTIQRASNKKRRQRDQIIEGD